MAGQDLMWNIPEYPIDLRANGFSNCGNIACGPSLHSYWPGCDGLQAQIR